MSKLPDFVLCVYKYLIQIFIKIHSLKLKTYVVAVFLRESLLKRL
jgi:hypothetical protein